MEEVKKHIKKECLPWIISPFNKLRNICIICQALFWDPGTYQSTKQDKIVFLLEMSSQLARKEIPMLQNTCCGVTGFLHILVLIYPREIQIPFSNITANFLLILLHRLHL